MINSSNRIQSKTFFIELSAGVDIPATRATVQSVFLTSTPAPEEPGRPIHARPFVIRLASDVAEVAVQKKPWAFEPAAFARAVFRHHG